MRRAEVRYMQGWYARVIDSADRPLSDWIGDYPTAMEAADDVLRRHGCLDDVCDSNGID